MLKAYNLELSPAAKRDLKRLPHSIQKKIVFQHLPAITKDPFLKSEPLLGTYQGERSYHFGRKPEYRIIFSIEKDLIIVTIIGSREGIYRRAKRRKNRKGKI
ncbi:MAG: type II toxin-antitoxin system RelE/ParE family toxin [bacterium]